MSKYFSVIFFNKTIAHIGGISFLVIVAYLGNKSVALAMNLNSVKFAIDSSDQKFIQMMIQGYKKAQLNIDHLYGDKGQEETLLMYAARSTASVGVRELLKAGASVHMVDGSDKETPLHLSMLIVNLATWDEDVAFNEEKNFNFALFAEMKSIIRALLKAGANIHAVNIVDQTPLEIAFYAACKYYNKGASLLLLELLPWYIYQRHTASVSPENIIKLQAIRNDYLNSQDAQPVCQSDPLLKWMFTALVDCTSKKQLIEKILQYLETAFEESQNIMIKRMKYLLIKEDLLLEEFNANFTAFKERFSSNLIVLEKLKNIFRYLYAKKLQKEIFSNLSRSLISQLMGLETSKNDSKSILDLKTARDLIIAYYSHASFESPLLNNFLIENNISKQERIIGLVTCFSSSSSPNKNTFVSEKSIADVLDKRINAVFESIKKIKVHLDHLIQEKGAPFDSDTTDVLIFSQ